MDSGRLIQVLVDTAVPVRPLSPPLYRSVRWIAVVIANTALLVWVMTPRPDLLEKLAEPRFVAEEGASIAVGVTAAIAALASTVPGYSRKVLFLPILPFLVWLATIGKGCVSDLMNGPTAADFQADWFCLPAIVLAGAVPAIAMVLMLRRGAPLTPATSVALAGLAAAGFGNFALRLFHEQDAGLSVLVWQFGTVLGLTALAGLLGNRLLQWAPAISGRRIRAG